MNNTPWPRVANFNLPLTKIGTLPILTTYNSVFNEGLQGYIIHGDAFFFSDTVTDLGSRTTSFIGIRIKRNGDSCIYRFGDGANIIISVLGHTCLGINNNTIIIGNSYTSDLRYITIPDIFISGGTVILKSKIFSPPAPCNAGNMGATTFFSSNQNLIACEFIQAYPAGTFRIWASIYNGDLDVIQTGYIGFFQPTDNDPFNRTSANLPDGVDASIWNGYPQGTRFANGWFYYYNEGVVDDWNMGAYDLNIVEGSPDLNCAEDNTSFFVETTSSFNFWGNEAPSNFLYSTSNPFGGAYCEVDGWLVSGGLSRDTFTGFNIFSKDFIVQFNCGVKLDCVIFNDGTVIGIPFDSLLNTNIPIYTAKIDFLAAGMVKSPTIKTRQSHVVINSTRPVDQNGGFIT